MKSALILFAHGAREAGWAEPFQGVRDRVAASRPDLSVEVAFLELMSPALGECVDRLVAAGHERIAIAPLFLAVGGHLKRDLPRPSTRFAGGTAGWRSPCCRRSARRPHSSTRSPGGSSTPRRGSALTRQKLRHEDTKDEEPEYDPV